MGIRLGLSSFLSIRRTILAFLSVCIAVFVSALLFSSHAYADDALTTGPEQSGPRSVYATSPSNFNPNFAKMANLPGQFPSAQGLAFDTYTGKDGYAFSLTNDRSKISITHFKQEGTKVTTVKSVTYTKAQLDHCNGATLFKQGNEKYLFIARGGKGNETAAMVKLSDFEKGVAKVYDVAFKNLDNGSGKDMRGFAYMGKQTLTVNGKKVTKDAFAIEVGRRMNLAYLELTATKATFVCVDSQRFGAPTVGGREGTAQGVSYHNGFLFIAYGDENPNQGGQNKTCMIEAIKWTELFSYDNPNTQIKFPYSYSKTYSTTFTPEAVYFTSLDGDNSIYLTNNDANNNDAIFKGTLPSAFDYKIWKRLAGSNALDTMEKITKEFGTASVAIVSTNALASKSNDAGYKDALAAAALAGSYSAPMLTTSKFGLSAKTSSELKRMGVKTVYLVGSANELDSNVEKQIKNLGITVKRISNKGASTRAIECAKQVKNRSKTVIIATQKNFKDALSISSYAYATKSPILYAELGNTAKLSNATVNYIKGGGFTQAIIVGGPVVLPAGIETQLQNAGIKAASITRLAGSNEYKTSRVIAEWACGRLKNGTGGGTGLYQYASVKFQPAVKLAANKLGVARADRNDNGWKDALAGAALCGKNKSVLLLCDDNAKPYNNKGQWTEDFVKLYKGKYTRAYIFGGTLAVSANVEKRLKAASM